VAHQPATATEIARADIDRLSVLAILLDLGPSIRHPYFRRVLQMKPSVAGAHDRSARPIFAAAVTGPKA
jgi:hypothetical protein